MKISKQTTSSCSTLGPHTTEFCTAAHGTADTAIEADRTFGCHIAAHIRNRHKPAAFCKKQSSTARQKGYRAVQGQLGLANSILGQIMYRLHHSRYGQFMFAVYNKLSRRVRDRAWVNFVLPLALQDAQERPNSSLISIPKRTLMHIRL